VLYDPFIFKSLVLLKLMRTLSAVKKDGTLDVFEMQVPLPDSDKQHEAVSTVTVNVAV